jgi:hypothetical protein
MSQDNTPPPKKDTPKKKVVFKPKGIPLKRNDGPSTIITKDK